jgi:hypothetical protein
MIEICTILVFWVVLPLAPALLIYKLIPNNNVTATGTYAGLKIKAGGAFAAYLVVFAGIYVLVDKAYDAVGASNRSAWTINGSFKLVDENGSTWHPSVEFFRKISVRMQPDVYSFQDNTFTITVPEGMQGGVPKIYLDTDVGPFGPLKLGNMDRVKKTNEIVEPIEVRVVPRNESADRRVQTMRVTQQ